MHQAALLLRIRVVRVPTRAAARSLGPAHPQVSDVVERGRLLLERLEPLVLEDGSDEARLAFAQAGEELDSIGGDS